LSNELENEIADSLVNGRLSCPVAFKIARKLNVTPMVVGKKADDVGAKISDCQLGCFGVKKSTPQELASKPLDNNVAKAVQVALIDGKLPCATAYEVARKLKVSRQRVGDTANQLKIRIADCQLGCF
jgi:hypothetical protein